MDWKQLVGRMAPTVAAALGSPLAGLAVAELAGALGCEDRSADAIERTMTRGMLTADAYVKLRELELAYQAKELELGLRFSELSVTDITSARQRESAVRDNMNAILAIIACLMFACSAGACLLLTDMSVQQIAVSSTVLGYASSKMEQVLSYYFGSTHGGARKNDAIVALAQKGGV